MKSVDGLEKKVVERPRYVRQKPIVEDFYFSKQRNKKPVNIIPGLLYILFFLIVSFGTVFSLDRVQAYKNDLEMNSRVIQDEIEQGLKGINENDYQTAAGRFKSADKKLTALKVQLQQTGQYIPYFFYLPQSDSKLNESTKIIKIVSTMTRSVSLLSNGLEALSSGNGPKTTDQIQLISDMTQKLTQVALNDKGRLEICDSELSDADKMLGASGGGYYSDLKKQLKTSLPEIRSKVKEAVNIYDLIPKIFAHDDTKNYLILFQNNSELRPAGGFLGSFAVAGFQDSALKQLDFETNIYKIDKPYMAKNPIFTPAEYLYVTPSLALRDSNYDQDFKPAAQKVMWFYSQETGKNSAGVIALDTTLITNLLKLIGPIEMPDYGLIVTGDNFLQEIEYQVEIGYFKDKSNWPENAPKKILSEMMPKIIQKTFSGLNNKEKRAQIVALINDSLFGKHLLFYADETSLQNYLEDQNYAGRISSFGGDYLLLSNSNIGGKKSSLNVKEAMSQKISLDTDGHVSKTVDIKRSHQGTYNWPDGINKTFNKLIVPEGSRIINYRILSGDDFPYSDWNNRDKGGIATSLEEGKTVFSFWLNTKPGETSELQINYQLPPELIFPDNYQLLIQKQPGTVGSNQNIEISSPRKKRYIKSEEYKNPINFVLDQDTILKADFR